MDLLFILDVEGYEEKVLRGFSQNINQKLLL